MEKTKRISLKTRLMDALEKREAETGNGIRYLDMIEILWKINHRGEFDRHWDRGYFAGAFSSPHPTGYGYMLRPGREKRYVAKTGNLYYVVGKTSNTTTSESHTKTVSMKTQIMDCIEKNQIIGGASPFKIGLTFTDVCRCIFSVKKPGMVFNSTKHRGFFGGNAAYLKNPSNGSEKRYIKKYGKFYYVVNNTTTQSELIAMELKTLEWRNSIVKPKHVVVDNTVCNATATATETKTSVIIDAIKQQSLNMAGMLAAAARKVTQSSIAELSENIARMESILNQYDDLILNNTDKINKLKTK